MARSTSRCGRSRHAPFLYLALALASVLSAVTACGPAPTPLGENGYSITTQDGATTIVTLATGGGSASTQYATRPSGERTAQLGAILRYGDSTFVVLDERGHTYATAPLSAVVQAQGAREAQVGKVGPNGEPIKLPPATLSGPQQTTKIAGYEAQGYVLSVAGSQERVWYAVGLPAPPANVARALATLEPVDADKPDCANAPTTAVDTCKVYGKQVAGRALLRVEIAQGSGWRVVLDATAVQPTSVPDATFALPAGWKSVPFPSAPAGAPAAAPAEVSGGAAAFPPAGWALPSTGVSRSGGLSPQYIVPTQGGPVMSDPRFYVYFWGTLFSNPAFGGSVAALEQRLNTFYASGYEVPLAQYGVKPQRSSVSDFFTVGVDPPAVLGTASPDGSPSPASWGVGEQFVWNTESTFPAPSSPQCWSWIANLDGDPVYALFVPTSVVGDTTLWIAYHSTAPSFGFFSWPGPANLACYPYVPWLVVKVQDPAIASQDAKSLDETTVRATHELVEAATDPDATTAFNDHSKPNPPGGEIGDICEYGLGSWGRASRVAGTAVSTYWSNKDQACVPDSSLQLTITHPNDGDTISWRAGGPSVSLDGTAWDPLDGWLTGDISWSVDGKTVGTGANATATALALGAHTITAQVTDSQKLSASDSVTITVTAQPPNPPIISSPNAGATYPADQLITFAGYASDPQDGGLSGSMLEWKVNGQPIGTGAQLPPRTISSVGDATVTLTATNSAKLSATTSITVHITPPQGNPTVKITSPTAPQGYVDVPVGTAITFTAEATAADGTPIPDGDIVWTDDLDGKMGTGHTIQFTLSGPAGGNPTVHHVTVTATYGGKTATDTIEVDVGTIY